MSTENKMRQWHFTALILLLCSVLLLSGNVAAANAQSLTGKKAPEITRRDLNGHALSLSQLRGKVVLLNFWATWCAPCQAEMPTFSQWQQQYGPQGLAAIGISMDDETAPARKLVNKMHLDYPVAMGDAALGRRYGGVLGLPMTFLIDRKGIVHAQFQGETSTHEIEIQLKQLLSKK